MIEDRSTPLFRLLADINGKLDELVHAISEYQKVQAAQRDVETKSGSERVVRLPPEIPKYYESEEKERPKANRREGLRTILECTGVVAAIILAILTLCTLRTYNGQLVQARRTNDDLEKQFQTQQRAWIGNGEITVKQTDFVFYPDNPIQAKTQVDLVIDVPLKNVGNSPAIKVQTWVTATASEQIGGPPVLETMMESACGDSARNAKSVGQVLFPNSPGTTVEWPMAMGTSFSRIDEIHRLWIDVCVTYIDTTADQHIHHTKIWMASWPIDGKPTEVRRIISPRVIYYSRPIPGWVVVKTEAD